MQIEPGKIVTLDFTITNTNGRVLDTSKGAEPLVFMHGTGVLVRGLEDALLGKSPGDFLHITLPPERAYGIRHNELLKAVPRADFASFPNIIPGMQFEAQDSKGFTVLCTIRAVTPESIILDSNHPLAGQTLDFDVTVLDVREASPQEAADARREISREELFRLPQ
jgi:FKBP-type peptidyl-prolyl cis-trans isomerase SlyD